MSWRIFQIWRFSWMLSWATKNAVAGHMLLAGRYFPTPVLNECEMGNFFQECEPSNMEKSVSDILLRIRFPFESSFWISVSGWNSLSFLDIQPGNRIEIISVAYTHLRAEFPDRSKKLSQNSLQKIAKLSKNLPNDWKWLHLYQNINFFTANKSFKPLFFFRLVFYQKACRFSTFCKNF